MWGWCMKSKIAKVGGGVAGGSGIIGLLIMLYSSTGANIDKAEARAKEYTDLKIEIQQIQVNNLKEKIENTNKKVNDIHKFLIKKNN